METVFAKLDAVRQADPVAVAMDIDAAGLPFLKGLTPPAGSKTVEELRQIIDYAKKPFIIKGIMTVRGAQKALEAGASAIVVSNHGGRVQDQCPSTAEVLPAIADAVGGKLTILVEGFGPGRGRRAHRPSLRHHGLWRRGPGSRRAGEEAPGGAGGHHGHVRRALPGGNPPGYAVWLLSHPNRREVTT